MVKQYAFYYDSTSCSGCKTCQMACKDKNNLEVGRKWRRVYEVSGGEWVQAGNTWIPNVYAYNVSMGCNHCEHPICLDACPSQAIHKREDGIVLIDQGKCVGCEYCALACPYGAPQYDKQAGKMSKCDFCFDYIDEGKSPACVDACPMRVLEFGELNDLIAKYGKSDDISPLPASSLTTPSLVITPHKDSRKAAGHSCQIANREEV